MIDPESMNTEEFPVIEVEATNALDLQDLIADLWDKGYRPLGPTVYRSSLMSMTMQNPNWRSKEAIKVALQKARLDASDRGQANIATLNYALGSGLGGPPPGPDYLPPGYLSGPYSRPFGQ